MAGELARLPTLTPRWEDSEILFVGVPRKSLEGVFTCAVTSGPAEATELDTLTLAEVEGGTWGDYLASTDAIRGWMRRASLGRSRHTLVVLDARSPLSVAVARSLPRGVSVLAIAASLDSTPMEQSCSYAALSTIHGAGHQNLIIAGEYADSLTLYSREGGIVRCGSALGYLAECFTRRASVYSALLARDEHLGVETHALSILPTTSDRVYRDPEHMLMTAAQVHSATYEDNDVLTLHLIARGPRAVLRRIAKAYRGIRASFPGLLDSDEMLTEVEDPRRLYDVAILYGLRGDPLLPLLSGGYEAVAKRSANMRLEEKP